MLDKKSVKTTMYVKVRKLFFIYSAKPLLEHCVCVVLLD